MDSDDYIPRTATYNCYELFAAMPSPDLPLPSLHNFLNFPDDIAINYCASSQFCSPVLALLIAVKIPKSHATTAGDFRSKVAGLSPAGLITS